MRSSASPAIAMARTAAAARYGLLVPSMALTSTFAVASRVPTVPGTNRMAASRFSTPQHAYAPDHSPGTSRS